MIKNCFHIEEHIKDTRDDIFIGLVTADSMRMTVAYYHEISLFDNKIMKSTPLELEKKQKIIDETLIPLLEKFDIDLPSIKSEDLSVKKYMLGTF